MMNSIFTVAMRYTVALLVLLVASPALSTNYHVRKGAGGSGTGADWTNAWDDINNITGIAAGDTVYIAAGSYTGDYTFSASGSAGNVITVKRATTAEHGSATGWNDSYDNTVSIDSGTGTKTFAFDGKHHLTFDGVDKTKFIITGTDGTRPNYGFYSQTAASYSIIIKNITVHDMANIGVNIQDHTGDIHIESVEVYKCGNGSAEDLDTIMTITGVATNGTSEIKDSYFHDQTFDDVDAATDLLAISTDNMYIHDCEFYPGWNVASSADSISIRRGPIWVYNNLFRGDAAHLNQRIFIETNNAAIDGIYIYNNLFYMPTPNTTAVGVAINVKTSVYVLDNFHVYNNTIYGHDWAMKFSHTGFVANYAANSVHIKNNIFHAELPELAVELEIFDKMEVDYNYYYQTAGGTIMTSNGYPVSNTKTLATARTAYAWETNGSEGDPAVDAIATTGFHLTASSPSPVLNGAATLSSFFTTDKSGTSRPQDSVWDIGAYEYAAAGGTTTQPDILFHRERP